MRVLFVTQTGIFQQFQQSYVVESRGMIPDLKTAEILLSAEDSLPDAVLFGPDVNIPAVLRLIRSIKTRYKQSNIRWVVVVNETSDFMADELQGLAQTIPQAESTPDNLARLLGVKQTQTGRTTFISAINIKGGTGKTTFLTNLAEGLSRRNLRVALVDADVVDGDVAQAMGVPRTVGTIDKLARELSRPDIDKATLFQQYLYPRSDNLFILPGPGRSDYYQDNLNEMTTLGLLSMLTAARFDCVLVDLPGHLRSTPFTHALAAQPNSRFFMLYHPSRPFEKDGFIRALQVLQGLGVHGRASIVVVEAADTAWTKIDQQEIETTTGVPVKACLPNDPIVAQSQAIGKSAFEFHNGDGRKRIFGQKSRFVTAMEALCDMVAGEIGGKTS